MKPQEIILNVAVNLGRIGRFASEGRQARLQQFLTETKEFVQQLHHLPIPPRFTKTQRQLEKWLDQVGAEVDPEEAYTWANILTHRAQLAS